MDFNNAEIIYQVQKLNLSSTKSQNGGYLSNLKIFIYSRMLMLTTKCPSKNSLSVSCNVQEKLIKKKLNK